LSNKHYVQQFTSEERKQYDKKIADRLKASSKKTEELQSLGLMSTMAYVSPGNTAYLTPVRNQGWEGACGPFSICAIREWFQRKNGQTFIQVSPQILYWRYKSVFGLTGDPGTRTTDLAEVACGFGFSPEADLPYLPGSGGNLNTNPDTILAPGQTKGDGSLESFSYADNIYNDVPSKFPTITDGIVSNLSQGIPVHLGFYVNYGFDNLVNGVADVSPSDYAKPGGHGVMTVDFKYDSSGNPMVLIKNSWGTGWGIVPPSPVPADSNTPGYCWMTKAYIEKNTISATVCMSSTYAQPTVYKFDAGPFATLALANSAKTTIASKGYLVAGWIKQVGTVFYVPVGQFSSSSLATSAKSALSAIGISSGAYYTHAKSVAMNSTPKDLLIQSAMLNDCSYGVYIISCICDETVTGIQIRKLGDSTCLTTIPISSMNTAMLMFEILPSRASLMNTTVVLTPVTSAGPQTGKTFMVPCCSH
jgi:hypothetical protein